MKKNIINRILILVLLAAGPVSLKAQKDQARLKDLLTKMQRAYQKASYLEFKVEYFYANQKHLNQHMDSLYGKVQMDKDRTRFVIDNSETVVTGKYTIQVMKQEKAIYLSSARRSGMMDPVGITDSILAHMEGTETSISKQGNQEVLTLTFPPGKQYTKVTMTIDASTGFLQHVSYDLHTASLVGQEMIDKPGHPGPYQSEGRVEVVFSSYRNGSFTDAVFDEHKFFNRVDGKFEATGQYKDFQIFQASSNL